MNDTQDSRLQVTGYDRMQGSLLSAIGVVGFLFATLFAIWWSHDFIEKPRSGGFLPPDEGRTLTEVSLDNYDLILELELLPTAAPQLSSDLDAVPEVVSTIQANQSKSIVDGLENSEGSRETGRIGLDGGPGGPGIPTPTLPEINRWTVVYESQDFGEYTQLLNSFKINVGVVRLNSNEIMRVKISGDGYQAVRSNRADENSSFYFTNTQATSRRWDAKIVRDANVDQSDSALVHFYPEQALARLRSEETKKVAGEGKTVEDILTTTFVFVPLDDGFEIRVDEISYR